MTDAWEWCLFISFADCTKKTVGPKRRKSYASESDQTTSTPKNTGSTPRYTGPLSERQQLALLKQMTAEQTQQQDTGNFPNTLPGGVLRR